MKKTTKSFIVSSSIILLITGTTVPSLFSLADVIDADKITSSSSSSNTKNEQSVTSKETSNSTQEIDSTVQSVSEKRDNEQSTVNTINTTASVSQTVPIGSSESLDSWMPSAVLQAFVATKLGIDKSQITKDLLANSQLNISYETDKDFFYLPSYEGLQFFSNISIYVSASSDDNTLSYLRLNPIPWDNFGSLTNLTIGVDGDLTAIFPNGIDLNDSRINIDPHNIYFMNDINLNQNNFKSFFLSYSELKLLNVDPSVFNYITDLNFGEGSYKVTPESNGLLFELTNTIDYSLLAGKSYVNTNEYLNFPDGPYVQLSTGSKNINSRINLHYNLLGAAVTVKYVDTKGNVISDEAIKSGNVGDSYTTEQKTIDGYTFKEVQGNATGTFTDQAQTVTYVYTKKPVLGAAVTVKYVDTKGNVISDEAVKSGNVGDSYTTEQKTIDGYTFKEVQGNSTGTFTDQAQTVTYVYTKKVLSELNLSPSSNSKTQFVSSKEQIKTLPQTGDNSTFTFAVSILGSLLLGVGLFLSLLRTRKTK
ncbi:MucBP domain-containing protein [Lactococcus lactis]|uniref:MucBP domain-containing protein n=3 Tax=Lactococcus lactis TaxID=1358 RepID=UPI0028FD5F99|nr:MucBP domain-containing protein [Lactococcus lactis]MDU0397703.1 Internalin-J [Lactococcus lactis]